MFSLNYKVNYLLFTSQLFRRPKYYVEVGWDKGSTYCRLAVIVFIRDLSLFAQVLQINYFATYMDLHYTSFIAWIFHKMVVRDFITVCSWLYDGKNCMWDCSYGICKEFIIYFLCKSYKMYCFYCIYWLVLHLLHCLSLI